MARPTSPLSFVWPAQSTTYFVNGQTTFTLGLPLTFVTSTTNTSPFEGTYIEIAGIGPTGTTTVFSPVITKKALMPAYNIRNVVVTTTSAPSGTITIAGLDINQNVLTEVINVTGSNTYYSVNYYSAITSVIPSFTSTDSVTLSVGTGNAGYTMWYVSDVWSKNPQYTMTLTGVSGTISLSPAYSINLFTDINNSVFATTAVGLYTNSFFLPATNQNYFAISPVATGFPLTVTTGVSMSFTIPLQGLMTAVSATTGAFTQTIMQQGGSV